jgi:hypothetical protein
LCNRYSSSLSAASLAGFHFKAIIRPSAASIADPSSVAVAAAASQFRSNVIAGQLNVRVCDNQRLNLQINQAMAELASFLPRFS